MRKQARVLKNVTNAALFRRQADTFINIVQHSAVEDDAPLLRARQAANGVNQRGFTRAGDAEHRRNAAGGKRLANLQTVGTQRLGKIELKHVYFPIR
ncbi:Uncharacterised protein [Klebsiella michiganensis]|nr:Uncharacterised protein [Klebsiella michiganensis]